MNAIPELSHSRTIVILSHRWYAVKEFDPIPFMADGRVAAAGSLDELVNSAPPSRVMARV
jgi:ABC-type multidrug transport system fused ATPase/permease subunit